VTKFHIKVIIEIELIKVQLNEVQLQVRLKVQVVIQVMLILLTENYLDYLLTEKKAVIIGI
jgi:hypothetical protein